MKLAGTADGPTVRARNATASGVGPLGKWRVVTNADGVVLAANSFVVLASGLTRTPRARQFTRCFVATALGATATPGRMLAGALTAIAGDANVALQRPLSTTDDSFEVTGHNVWQDPSGTNIPITIDYAVLEVVP